MPLDDLPATLPPELAPLTFLVGRWERGDSAEHWFAIGDVLYGIGLGPNHGYEVVKVDRADGRVRYVAQPMGGAPVPFPLDRHDAASAVFLNPTHDDPQRIGYRRTGDKLEAGVGPAVGPDSLKFKWKLRDAAPAPELEAADRAFAAAVAIGGVDAWVAAFSPGGHQWDEDAGAAVPPGDAMRTYMAGRLAGKLAWEPVYSGLGPGGDLGYTVGSWSWTAPDATAPARTGAYVTVWHREPDGTWKVWFDTGDPVDG